MGIFEVNVKINDDEFKNYVAKYVTQRCQDEVTRQLENTSRSLVARYIQLSLQNILKEPSFTEQLRSIAGEMLALGEDVPGTWREVQQQRDVEIYNEHKNGVPASVIAELYGLTPTRIKQIIKQQTNQEQENAQQP